MLYASLHLAWLNMYYKVFLHPRRCVQTRGRCGFEARCLLAIHGSVIVPRTGPTATPKRTLSPGPGTRDQGPGTDPQTMSKCDICAWNTFAHTVRKVCEFPPFAGLKNMFCWHFELCWSGLRGGGMLVIGWVEGRRGLLTFHCKIENYLVIFYFGVCRNWCMKLWQSFNSKCELWKMNFYEI